MAELEKLRAVLERVAGSGPLLTVQPGGNYGDWLIYDGFEKFIETTVIETIPLAPGKHRDDTPPSFPTASALKAAEILGDWSHFVRKRITESPAAVYMQGGGNFNDIWGNGIRCYRTISRCFNCPIVVGPQSVQFDESDPYDIFSAVDNETHFFCRERYSQEILEPAVQNLSHVESYLDEDTALYLERGDLVDEVSEDFTLVAFRDDRDSAAPLIESTLSPPIRVQDISTTAPSYEEFVEIASRAERVFTDRLHGMILAAILGKPVTAYETGYHKNRGVYEYSLTANEAVDFKYIR